MTRLGPSDDSPLIGRRRQPTGTAPLEVADPLGSTAIEVAGYMATDAAFLSWFARALSSTGIDGRYTLLGTFTSPAPTCP